MALLLVFVVMLVVLAASVFALSKPNDRWQRVQTEWVAAAGQLQLATREDEDTRAMYGELLGVPVHVDFTHATTARGESRRTIEVATFSAGKGIIPASLEAHIENPWGEHGSLARGPDRDTGDHEFDRQVDLATMDAYVCAALSEPARAQLVEFMNSGGTVSSGAVSWRTDELREVERLWLIERTERIARFAKHLGVTPDTLAARLAHNAVHDSQPDVRIRNLQFLLAPETAAPVELVKTTARTLLTDQRHIVRFHAARALGVEGHAALRALTTDPHAEVALRARAVSELHEQDAAGIAELVASFLIPSPRELVCAALAVVAARRLSAHVERVIALFAGAETPVRVAAARTLGALESPAIEPYLLRLCADEEAEVQIAAAESLAIIGGVDAVEPLVTLTQGFGGGAVRQAVRSAIARIQSRLGDVEGGRVSLAEDDELAGAVALIDGELAGGELTLAADAHSRSHGKRA